MRAIDLSPDREAPWCKGRRCDVTLAGVGRPWGICIRCGRHWGSGHPAGDGTPLERLRGRAHLGLTLDFSEHLPED
jgi:hypothetical protein